jgi:preprotein translocase subunit SecY
MEEVSQATSSKSMVDVSQLLDASQLLLELHQLQSEMRGMRDMVQPVHRDDIQSLKKLLTIGLAVIVSLIVVLWYQIQ